MLLAQTNNEKLKKIAATASIFLALFLCFAKALAFFYTESLAVLSSMVDSLSDVLASMVTFWAVKVSVRPATNNYRYGYGKVEALSALFQAGFVAASGLFILYDSVDRIRHPVVLVKLDFGLIIMVLSLVATLALVAFQRVVAKRTKSQAILADSLHYSVDILTNISIIVSLFVIHFWGIVWVDTVIAGFISVYLLYNAYDLGRDAVRMLLDKELSDDIRKSIFDIVAKHQMRLSIHDLRTRDLGNAYLFEFHLELDGKLDLYTAHKYTEEVENLIRNIYPDAQIIIHQDPVGIKEERLDNLLKL
ncbi:MAG: cation diffusion facilitator family transporter [Alphaproteobacteria bacterium]|nr:cation diffusion facilitator family transporter [Alphaproteobacteria bacterium]